jgi:uncharacterized protein with HEPN domain
MKNENSVRLKHILDAIASIETYLEGFDEHKFGKDKLRQDRVIRQLEIIGEATKNLTDKLREENPQIPWRKAAGIRDRLAHGYYEISLKIIWDTVQNDLPTLKTEIEKILEEESKK